MLVPNIKIIKGKRGLSLQVGDTLAHGVKEIQFRETWSGDAEITLTIVPNAYQLATDEWDDPA